MHIKKVKNRGDIFKPPISKKIMSGHVVLHQGEGVAEHVAEGGEEMIYIVAGQAVVVIDGEREKIEAGTAAYVPYGKTHSIKNEDEDALQYIYVVTPIK